MSKTKKKSLKNLLKNLKPLKKSDIQKATLSHRGFEPLISQNVTAVFTAKDNFVWMHHKKMSYLLYVSLVEFKRTLDVVWRYTHRPLSAQWLYIIEGRTIYA